MSGQDVDGGVGLHQGVEFVDFAVGYGDAAVGPVAAQVLRADGAEAVFEAVDFDVAAGASALRGGAGAVGVVG